MLGDFVCYTEYAQAVTAIYEFGNFAEIFLPTPQMAGGYAIIAKERGGLIMRWDIGIDLGTRNVRMLAEGAPGALAQAAALAVREGAEAPLCFGDAAMALYGRECAGVEVCFPLSDGTLRNGDHARALFTWLYGLAGDCLLYTSRCV